MRLLACAMLLLLAFSGCRWPLGACTACTRTGSMQNFSECRWLLGARTAYVEACERACVRACVRAC
eukprot:5245396-Alexandrium_andersonii.AAC.1